MFISLGFFSHFRCQFLHDRCDNNNDNICVFFTLLFMHLWFFSNSELLTFFFHLVIANVFVKNVWFYSPRSWRDFWEKYTKTRLMGNNPTKSPICGMPDRVSLYYSKYVAGVGVCLCVSVWVVLITTSFTNIEVLQLRNFPSFHQPLAQLSWAREKWPGCWNLYVHFLFV